jgi:hypothetical protein
MAGDESRVSPAALLLAAGITMLSISCGHRLSCMQQHLATVVSAPLVAIVAHWHDIYF